VSIFFRLQFNDMTQKAPTLNAWQHHLQSQKLYHAPSRTAKPAMPVVTDWDFLRQEHRFLRAEQEQVAAGPDAWATRMAMRYESKLFKEYALCDLSRYRTGQIGLRWRHKREVVEGKGETICGNKNGCDVRVGLRTLELPFTYTEAGETKTCLVKVRLCSDCARKASYKKDRDRGDGRRHRRRSRSRRRDGKHSRSESGSESESGSSSSSSNSSSENEPSSSIPDSRNANAAAMEIPPESSNPEADSSRKRRKGAPVKPEPPETTPNAPDAAAFALQEAQEREVWRAPPKAQRTAADDYDDYFRGRL